MNIQNNPAAIAVGGINKGFERLADNTQKIVNPQSGQQVEALVDNTQVEKQVQASTKALKTYDGMIGTLLDVMA
ncbi:hypothetical protein [Thiomicrorhabdus sp.]|jgi:hypothetical protein|uniref:hypothetical protein n=1 Tax=Thiomicrorhabdus sp. TaxID=2039724 RepID=UPI0035698EDE